MRLVLHLRIPWKNSISGVNRHRQTLRGLMPSALLETHLAVWCISKIQFTRIALVRVFPTEGNVTTIAEFHQFEKPCEGTLLVERHSIDSGACH